MTEHRPPPRRRWLQQAGSLGIAAVGLDSAMAQRPEVPILRRPIPSSGELLPVVGLGTWQVLDVGDSATERAPLKAVLRQLVESGGSVVDSSPMYGRSEGVAGDLAAELDLRARLFMATKVWTSGRDSGIRQMEESFRRMRVQTMDLMQIHNLLDWQTHAETLAAWKAQGRIRYIGITHYHAGAYAELERVLKARRWDFVQLNYSVSEREAEERLLPLAQDLGVAVLVNRPFASGGLFSKVRGKPLPDGASDIGCTSWAQLFLKWILGHPAATCVIPASRKPEHMGDNMLAGVGPLPDTKQRQRIAAAVAAL